MFRVALRSSTLVVPEIQKRLSVWANSHGWTMPPAEGSADFSEQTALVRVGAASGDQGFEFVLESAPGLGGTVVRALDSEEYGFRVWLEHNHPGAGVPELLPRPRLFDDLLAGDWLSLGGKPLGVAPRLIDGGELSDLLEAEGPRPLVIATLTADGLSSAAQTALEDRVGGMAHLLTCASDAIPASPSGWAVPPGGVMTIGQAGGVDVIPSTVCKQKPDASARRVQRLLLHQSGSEGMQADRHLRRLLLSSDSAGLPDEWAQEFEAMLQEKELAEASEKESREAYELSVMELDEVLGEADSLRRQVRFFETRLRELGDYQGGLVLDDDGPPDSVDSFVELLEVCAEHLRWVSLGSSVAGPAMELDSYPQAGSWAKRCWQALQALDDYARLKGSQEFKHDFQRYCGDTPSGVTPFQVSLLSLHESESTMSTPSCVAKRTFPVPSEVDPSGKAVMEPHTKLQKAGALAPRMHFLDDTGGRTRKIHVGYIGQHLPIR